MSGDLVYGDIEGSYEGFTAVALTRLAIFVAALALGLFWKRPKLPRWLGAVLTPIFIVTADLASVNFAFSGFFWISVVLGCLSASSGLLATPVFAKLRQQGTAD